MGVGVAAGGGDGGVTDADAPVSTASDGFGAGVPSGVATATGIVASGGCVATTLAVGVGLGAVATLFMSPAPDNARGTMPSNRKRSATIPMPQRA